MEANKLKINQLIEITALEGLDEHKYLPSRIEEVSPDYLYISPPMFRGEILPLRVREPLRIHFTLEGHFYRFDTVVVERVAAPLPLLAVLKPAEIVEVQRRRWVRLPVNLPVKFQLEHSIEAEIYEGRTIDISGGGMQYRSETALEPGTMIHLCLDLPHREPICCKAKVLRFEEGSEFKGQEAKIVVEFFDISEGQRDRIMNYIFEKQREWIRKGLL